MDLNHFDELALVVAAPDSRRRVLRALLALPALPVASGLLGVFQPEEAAAKDRRRRRKQRHKRRKNPGNRKQNGSTNKGKSKSTQPCTLESRDATCAGKCGSVQNSCGQTVDCGTCDCNPVCDECFTCQGTPGTPGVCVPKEAGALCSGGGTCEQGEATPRSTCDDSGRCVAASPISCAPYTQCADDVCADSCQTNNECVEGSYCGPDGTCLGDQENGESCDHGGQCKSGHCTNGFCCDVAACDQCHSCGVAGLEGTCHTEPDGSPCSDGDACTQGDTCQSGVCQSGATVRCRSDLTCCATGPLAGQCGAPAGSIDYGFFCDGCSHCCSQSCYNTQDCQTYSYCINMCVCR